MTNFDNDARRLAAEAEALMALIDADLHADDPTHPDHVPMPSDAEITAMAARAFARAQTIVEAETAATSSQVTDEMLAEVLMTWTAELELVSSTSRGEPAGEGRLWKVGVTDPDLIAAVLGPDIDDIPRMTVSDVPTSDGTAVTVTLALPDSPTPGITLVAVVDYRNGVLAQIPLQQTGPDDTTLSGHTVLASDIGTAHPVIRLDVRTRS